MREQFRFREPSHEDAEKLAELGRDTFIETFGHLYHPSDLHSHLAEVYSEEAIREELGNPALSHLVVADGYDLIAFIKTGPLNLPVSAPLANAGEIKQLYVRKPFLGHGLGKQLISRAQAQMESEDIDHLYLSVFSENHRAIRFYEGLGFQKCGEYQYPVGTHLDLEWIMHRPFEHAL
ncbi:MAG: GNAT family N-acetyltransferase [Akkermansiaceae bacterium]|jgi:ribosomal protein S18 acetylase RimI-like enzyme